MAEVEVKKGKKSKQESGAKMAKMAEEPEYLQHRIEMFDQIMARSLKEKELKERKPIEIKLLDGKVFEGVAYQTTPMEIALKIAKSLAEKTVIAKVNNQLWDLTRELEEDCELQLLSFDSEDGKKVFFLLILGLLAFFCACPWRSL
jgi:threonyl-tRNA synthetase